MKLTPFSDGAQPLCRTCRHANHGTEDASDGLLACPWAGSTSPEDVCRVRFLDTGALAFELFDGQNGTWKLDVSLRSVPPGFENRPVEIQHFGDTRRDSPELDLRIED